MTPGRFQGIRRLLHLGATPRSILRDVDDEMRFHLHMRIEDLMHQGHSAHDAESKAVREFGDLSAARSELASIDRRVARQGWWREWLGSLSQDVRFALRGLRSRPAFSATILLTLALGIGANAAIFSVVDAVLLRPLPYARPDRLVHLWETYEGKVDNRSEASFPDYLDWRARNRTFADLGGYHGGAFLYGGAQPMSVPAARVTANFFDVLGVHASIGRTFAAGEDAIGAPRVAMLAFGFWRRELAGDRSVVGRTIQLDGNPATVIGVLPLDFQFARQGDAEIWAPISRDASWRENRGNHWIKVVARLRDGATLNTARADMSSIMHTLGNEFPRTNSGRDGQVVPLQQEFVGSIGPILVLVYGAVVVVLLVACVNVANLILMRGSDRQREIAVRVALGAGKARLVRQLLTESLLLAVCGGILGLVVAQIGVHWLIGLIPASQLRTVPVLATAGLDPRVVVYAFLSSIVAGLGFGVVPAIRMTSPALNDALKNAGRGSIGGASRLRDALVAGELALTVILMSGALLFGKSLVRLMAIDPGFRGAHVTTTAVTIRPTQYPTQQSALAFFDRFTDRMRQSPGVDAVGLTTKLPFDWGNSLGFTIVGQPVPEPSKTPTSSYRVVNGDYFRAMGIPVLRGRVFGAGDDQSAPSAGIVNHAFAVAYLGGKDPTGQVIQTRDDTIHIVGMVADVVLRNLDETVPPTLYISFARNPQSNIDVAVRTNAASALIAGRLRETLSSIDPTAAMTPPMTMDDIVSASPSVFLRRFPLFLVGAFAMTALVLAIVGIYGVVSYSVAQRTREMGIRMALGAQPASLIALVVRQGTLIAAAGIAIGIVAAVLLGRFAETLLYGVRSSDPATYVSVSAVLAAVAIGATLVPARRATRVDPSTALRSD